MTKTNSRYSLGFWRITVKRLGLVALALVATETLSVVTASTSIAINTTTCKSFTTNEAFCNEPLTAGVRIENEANKPCTAGALVLPKAAAKRSETFLLTAGHCLMGETGKPWFAKTTTGAKKEIGIAGVFINGRTADAGVIKINDPGAWALTTKPTLYAVMAKWGTLGKEFASVPVIGESTPALSRKICMEGQTTGESCGKILKLTATLEGTENLAEAEGTKSESGDSGGSVYNNESSNLLIEGINIGHLQNGHTVFEPLATAFRELNAVEGLNLELLTTANELRNKQTKSGAFVLEGGGATLECTGVEGVSNVSPGGGEVTEGSTLVVNIQKWTGCTAKSSLIKSVAANVKECLLQFEGVNKAKASIVNECTVEVKVLGTCVISLPGGQKGLEKNLLENSGENLLIKAEDTGITSKPNASCLGVKETKEAKLKATLTALGLKEV